MLLSICIPTYNRGPLLAALVRSVLETLPDSLRDSEVVISDNHSTDDTAALVMKACKDDQRVRICRPDAHLPTAEENLCFAVSQCRGDYVWSLGDDDSPDREALATLAGLLQSDEHDFIVFNSRAISYQGILRTQVQVPCLAPRLVMPLVDFVRTTGFWYVLAGFSMSVFRRSSASTDEFRRILGIGRIYAHVAWLISCFHDKRFIFVNEPLVSYRENRYVTEKTDHWLKVSEREGVFDGALWSTAFLRFIDDLVARNVVERTFVREVIDRSPVHRFFFPDEMMGHFLRGLRADVLHGKGNVPAEEIEYFLDWGMVLWADNIVLLSLLEEAMLAKRAGKAVRSELVAELTAIHESRATWRWYDHFHRYDAYGYAVFHHAGRWFAVRRDSFHLVDGLLDMIDFDGCAGLLRVEASEMLLLKWLQARPRRPQPRPVRTEGLSVDSLVSGFDSRMVARAIRTRGSWRFHEWFRLFRALVTVAKRSILRRLGLRR